MALAIDPLIRLDGISKIFHTEEVETHALSRVALEIRAGEFVAIRGPSGCGKTTLLSILGLLDSPSEDGAQVMELLGELNAEGATVVIVTHDLRYLGRAGRHVFLFDGSIVPREPIDREVA